MKDLRDRMAASRTLTDQLRSKSRQRRDDLGRLANAAAPPRAIRNDLLPALTLINIALDELRMPARKIRRLDPAHVREVANAIGALGFCAPVLVGNGNLVLDGSARIEAARLLGLDRVACVRIEHLSEGAACCVLPSIGSGKRASGISTRSRLNSRN